MTKRRVWLLAAICIAAGCAGFMKKKAALQPDQGMTSDIHKENIGKIVFASAEIEKGKEDADGFKKSFQLGAPIYARVYLARSLYNEAIATTGDGFDATGFELRASIDGDEVNKHTGKMESEWTTYKFVIVRGADDTKPWDESAWFAEKVLPKLTDPGAHQVKLELWPKKSDKVYGTKPVATGSFKLVAGDDVAKAVKKVQKLDQNAGEARGAAAKADHDQHIAAGERWVNFSMNFCFHEQPMFEWTAKNGASGNASSGTAQWIPKGAKVELCPDATHTNCHKYAVISDEEEQQVDYECPH